MLAGSATCGMVRDLDQPTVSEQLGSCNESDMLQGTRVGPSAAPELSAEKLPSGLLPVGRANRQSANNAS
jgi:hypothetical protein